MIIGAIGIVLIAVTPVFVEPNPVAGVFTEGTKLVFYLFFIIDIFLEFFPMLLHRVALGIRVALGECLVFEPKLLAVRAMALDLVDPLKDAARVVRDIRRAVFREAAEKSGRRRRPHNDEAEERDAPIHGPPQMLNGLAARSSCPRAVGCPSAGRAHFEDELYRSAPAPEEAPAPEDLQTLST